MSPLFRNPITHRSIDDYDVTEERQELADEIADQLRVYTNGVDDVLNLLSLNNWPSLFLGDGSFAYVLQGAKKSNTVFKITTDKTDAEALAVIAGMQHRGIHLPGLPMVYSIQ